MNFIVLQILCLILCYLKLYNVLAVSQNQTKGFTLVPEGKRRVTAFIGESAKLECPLRCSPDCVFIWSHNNKPISSQQGRLYFTTITMSTLNIREVKPEDTGNYNCIGENGYGSYTGTIRLIANANNGLTRDHPLGTASNVGTAPSILIEFLPVKAVVMVGDQTQRLHCEAKGYPLPSVIWFQNNKPVPSSSHFGISVIEVSRKTTKDVTGSYRCDARNELGLSTYEVLIKIEEGTSVDSASEGGNDRSMIWMLIVFGLIIVILLLPKLRKCKRWYHLRHSGIAPQSPGFSTQGGNRVTQRPIPLSTFGEIAGTSLTHHCDVYQTGLRAGCNHAVTTVGVENELTCRTCSCGKCRLPRLLQPTFKNPTRTEHYDIPKNDEIEISFLRPTGTAVIQTEFTRPKHPSPVMYAQVDMSKKTSRQLQGIECRKQALYANSGFDPSCHVYTNYKSNDSEDRDSDTEASIIVDQDGISKPEENLPEILIDHDSL